MNLADEKKNQLDSFSQEILSKCETVSDLILVGNYEEAKKTLGDYWRGIGQHPSIEGLPLFVSAEVLLQCGVLTGWLGTSKQVDVQEFAKDLITESLHAFQFFNKKLKISEAQYELGMCYWRCGAFSEARVVLAEALKDLEDIELKGKILIRQTLIEISVGRYHEAWNILNEVKPFFDQLSEALKGKWHGQMAIVLRRIATAEQRHDYADRAIIEFTAAIYHYEQAGHERYCATNLNNLAMLLHKVERYSEAHEHLDRAEKILTKLKDVGLIAQVKETRARAFLAEEKYNDAHQVINQAIYVLEKGGEQALLSGAMTIQAIVMARIKNHQNSIDVFRQSIKIADKAGAISSAGLATLSLIEEHYQRLSIEDLFNAYNNADKFLTTTQDLESISRLRNCARIVIRKLFGPSFEDYFSLPEVVLEYEGRFIAQALEAEKGVITRAAKRLGISHQSLGFILKTRQKHLLDKRTSPIKRKKSIVKYY
jgi:tetratricopeptide (TPR) repeat protein